MPAEDSKGKTLMEIFQRDICGYCGKEVPKERKSRVGWSFCNAACLAAYLKFGRCPHYFGGPWPKF